MLKLKYIFFLNFTTEPPQTDEERQQHAQYDQWLSANAVYIGNQMKDIEGKVNKHRRTKKSLSAKQRNAKKVRLCL